MHASAVEDDPILNGIFQFLARDIEAHPRTHRPDHGRAFGASATRELGPIDHDAPIEGEPVLQAAVGLARRNDRHEGTTKPSITPPAEWVTVNR